MAVNKFNINDIVRCKDIFIDKFEKRSLKEHRIGKGTIGIVTNTDIEIVIVKWNNGIHAKIHPNNIQLYENNFGNIIDKLNILEKKWKKKS